MGGAAGSDTARLHTVDVAFSVIERVCKRRSTMSSTHLNSPRWRDAVREQFGVGQHETTLDSLAPLLDMMRTEQADLAPYLKEFGRRCGAAGHSLDDTAVWISIFATTAERRIRIGLLARHAAIQLAGGWMMGHDQLVAATTVDPFDVSALKVRLIQEYDRHDAFGLDVTRQISLVVLEPVFSDEPVPSAVIAAAARQAFRFGHTVAECPNGRVVVLTEHGDDVANMARNVAAKAARSVGSRPGAVRAWIETLASDRSSIDAFLSELTG